MQAVGSLGWDSYQADHEDANGQYELNFHYADCLITADRYTFFKMMTSQYAQNMELLPLIWPNHLQIEQVTEVIYIFI